MITWKPYFNTGIALVDEQHRGLVNVLNEAAPLLCGQDSNQNINIAPLLDKLTQYTLVHFKTEDELMRSASMDTRHLEHHRLQHSGFVDQITVMRGKFEQDGKISGSELVRFLTAWLTFHILGEDQVMARQLRAVEAGATPEQAYDMESERPQDPAQAALTDSLVDLFSLMSQQNGQLHEANQRIEQYRDHLEDLVRERATELARTNQALRVSLAEAEAANLAKSRFLRTISHELLTPLNAISGFAHLLKNADLPAKPHEHASKIDESARGLTGQIRDVITFATLEAGGVKERHTAFEPGLLLAHIESQFAAKARVKGLLLRQQIDPSLPHMLKGDAAHIGMVLEQYVRNAVHFTEQGEITLRIEWARSGASAETNSMAPSEPARSPENALFDDAPPTRLVRFEVEDTGPGLSAETQSRLFHAFEQGDGSLTRRHGGMGLGLAIVSGLAQLLHGHAGVTSKLEHGSTFWLEIPLASLDIAPQASDNATCSLEALLTDLRNDDMQARQTFANLSPEARRVLGNAHLKLTEQLAKFDFASALQTLEDTINKAHKTGAEANDVAPEGT